MPHSLVIGVLRPDTDLLIGTFLNIPRVLFVVSSSSLSVYFSGVCVVNSEHIIMSGEKRCIIELFDVVLYVS